MNTIKKLDEIYANEKAKGFLTHLLKAYFPVSKVKLVLTKPRNVEFRCCLTKKPLAAVDDILSSLSSIEQYNDANALLDLRFNEADLNSTIGQLLKEKGVCVQGNNTETYMSLETYQGLYTWVSRELFKGNMFVNKLLGKVGQSMYFAEKRRVENADIPKHVNVPASQEMSSVKGFSNLYNLDFKF